MLRLPKLASKVQFMHGEIPTEESVTFIHHLGTFWVEPMFNIEHLQLLEAISVTQSQSEWNCKSWHLPGIFHDNTMPTVDQNHNLWQPTTLFSFGNPKQGF